MAFLTPGFKLPTTFFQQGYSLAMQPSTLSDQENAAAKKLGNSCAKAIIKAINQRQFSLDNPKDFLVLKVKINKCLSKAEEQTPMHQQIMTSCWDVLRGSTLNLSSQHSKITELFYKETKRTLSFADNPGYAQNPVYDNACESRTEPAFYDNQGREIQPNLAYGMVKMEDSPDRTKMKISPAKDKDGVPHTTGPLSKRALYHLWGPEQSAAEAEAEAERLAQVAASAALEANEHSYVPLINNYDDRMDSHPEPDATYLEPDVRARRGSYNFLPQAETSYLEPDVRTRKASYDLVEASEQNSPRLKRTKHVAPVRREMFDAPSFLQDMKK